MVLFTSVIRIAKLTIHVSKTYKDKSVALTSRDRRSRQCSWYCSSNPFSKGRWDLV